MNDVEELADQLIALRCGTHSLGLVYDFLVKAYDDPHKARGDFVRFLSGQLPDRVLEEAALWVSEEQECEYVTVSDALSQLAAQSEIRDSRPLSGSAARL
jgi:hypothetical protein